ncbi:MAG: ferredoxin, partial [Gammaproteobacteria bacterium]|nr:ferredoxin [Gammaproteobacteria bacterium]
MTLKGKTLKLCNCNRTIPLDAKGLAAALKADGTIQIHSELCRKESGAFQATLHDPDVLVACTQEAPLFTELATLAEAKTELRFFNIREAAGWSAEGRQATPKDSPRSSRRR